MSLKRLRGLVTLESGHPGLLGITKDELDPTSLASLLCEQVPSNIIELTLRGVCFHMQTRIVLEQLAQLKTARFFPSLKKLTVNFRCTEPVSYVVGPAMMGPPGPFVGGSQGTAEFALPIMVDQVRAELGGMYKEAGIELSILQID